ncbi:MAG: SDR family NAD(P)-dependent oxidoreductase [Spirochaetaceae bacterium]|nr:MAG: SDR family NAD(P)-dependent oxidoreductase [Spirochaetaceae bacterium]
MSFATGKRILITGANSGIGFETAKQLAAYGAEVIMLCRNKERGEAARARILKQDPDADLTLLLADLSSGNSIQSVVKEIRRRYSSLHVLINNAGGFFTRPHLNDENIEYTFALNHLGPFRLTNALIDLLQAGAREISEPSRVITVSSGAHMVISKASPESIAAYSAPGNYKGFRAYAWSKLANILFTRELHKRYGDKGITAVSLHPGFVRTNFTKLDSKSLTALFFDFGAKIAAIPASKGAETPVFLADAESITAGMYYAKKKITRPAACGRSDSLSQALWDYSTRFLPGQQR